MSTKSNLIFLREALTQWAKARQGTCAITADLLDVFGMLSTKPGGFRVLIKAKGEDPRDIEEAPMFDRRYWVYLSYGRSMQYNPGDAWVKGPSGGEAWADLIDSCVAWIRGLTFDPDTTEGNPNYRGWKDVVEVHPGFLVDGIVIEFTIGCEPADASADAPAQTSD